MVRDDPFGLSEDRGLTRVRPVAAARAGPAAMPANFGPRVHARAHSNPLVRSFATLLEFAPELENVVAPENPDVLRARLLEELISARDRAVAAGVPLTRADVASWIVAALLDDLALNTPWGGASAWPRQPLVVMLHGDVDAGAQFFTRLEELERHPGRDRDLLELHYLCLALGFRGKFRVPGRAGDRSLAATRAAAARHLRDPDAEGADLSPHWQGVSAPDEKRRFAVPIWVLPAIAVVLATATHFLLSAQLSSQAEQLSTLVRAIPPEDRAEIYRPIQRAPPPDAPPVQPIEIALVPEFQAAAPPGLLPALRGKENASLATLVVQWTNPELFVSARPKLTEGFEPLFVSIARVIAENQEIIGAVKVVGHTDSVRLQPTNPLSNNQRLSEARAETIANILVANGVPPDRITSEGRAATQPVADNGTREGRAANRRIEVVVEKRL
jgi:type VI secretion system protein ImpK